MSPRILGLSFTIAVSTALMGPFGTFSSMKFPERALFWPIVVFISVLSGVLLQALSRRASIGRPLWLRTLLEGVCLGVFLVPLIKLLAPLIAGQDYVFRLAPLEIWAVIVLSYSMVTATLRYSDADHRGQSTSVAARPRLLARLPENEQGEVTHLTVDDHYVEITMSSGNRHRLLLRFADAVNEMDGVDGVCVHRSHWVTRAAIWTVYREKGRDFIILKSGDVVPVGRTYRPNLVSAGLLPERD